MRLLVALLVVAAVAGVSAAAPFVYGEKRAPPKNAPAPEPPVRALADATDSAVDKEWKAEPNPRVVANLAVPKPVKDKHKSPYHQAGKWVSANLKDPKPKLKKARADQGVRAHILTREPYTKPKDEDRVTARAHVVQPDAPRAPRKHNYVFAHSIEEAPRKKQARKRDLVVANAHIDTDKPVRKPKRVRETVMADAHITPERRAARKAIRARNAVVADAHITSDRVARKAKAKRVHEYVTPSAHITVKAPRGAHKHKRVHDYVTPVAHITRDTPRRRQPKKKVEREIVSADVVTFPAGSDFGPAARKPRAPKPEPELVSADIKIV